MSVCINDLSEIDERKLSAFIKSQCQKPFANAIRQWAICETLTNSNAYSQCSVCDRVFKSRQSRTLHEFKSHGIKDSIRLYAPFTSCITCMSRNSFTYELRGWAHPCPPCRLFKGPQGLFSGSQIDQKFNVFSSPLG